VIVRWRSREPVPVALDNAAAVATAGEADVIDAKVRWAAAHVCGFNVTVGSKDAGWDGYAERFEVLSPDGRILGTRALPHPMTASSRPSAKWKM
jgi:hypothetical protein